MGLPIRGTELLGAMIPSSFGSTGAAAAAGVRGSAGFRGADSRSSVLACGCQCGSMSSQDSSLTRRMSDQGLAVETSRGGQRARVVCVKRLTLSDACTSKQIKLPKAAVSCHAWKCHKHMHLICVTC
eukprot:357634-Chlamydomonas_euryale.AAC.5